MSESEIPGYMFGDSRIAQSPVSLDEFESLKATIGFDASEEAHLRKAGDVLAPQVVRIVAHWRSEIIASIPHLARHSRSTDGSLLSNYLARSNRRFEQWILDTCRRPYDQAWLNYQHEIALRHTAIRKNQVDDVASTPYIPFRDITAFIAVMNETMKTYLAADADSLGTIENMHRAWCKSLQLQLALWAQPYCDPARALGEW